MAGNRPRPIDSFFSSSTSDNTSKKRAIEPLPESESDGQVQKKQKSQWQRKFQESWKAVYSWLIYHPDENMMVCKFCSNYHGAEGTDFAKGSKHFKKETLQKHNDSARHKLAMEFCLCKEKTPNAIAKSLNNQARLEDKKSIDDLKIKFVTSYVIAKEEMPFTKFPVLLQVQRKNGLQINKLYESDVKCAELIHCISDCMKDELVKSLRDSEFFSVLIDAATDSGNKENEAVVLRYVKDGVTETRVLGVIELEQANSEGTVAAVDGAFLSADEDLILENHMIGFCSDGASVNFGVRSGVAKKLTDRCPWLIPIWCLPHRLELAVTDMLKKSDLGSKVVDALHLIYKTYHYSPKSKRELQVLARELGVRIKTPTRVKGTRWSPHTEKALQILMLPQKNKTSSDEGQYSIVYNHMEHLSATSTNADVKGRATHLVRLMKTFNFIAFCHILLDVLQLVSCLSCDLQDNKTILMTATTSIKSTMTDLELLKTTPLEDGSTSKFIEFIKSQAPDDIKFQGLSISGTPATPDLDDLSFDTLPLSLRRHINEALSMVTDGMKNRFRSILGNDEDDNQAKVIKSFSVFNHDTWPESEIELKEHGNEQVLFITQWFEAVLLSNGCSLQSVLKEWKALKVLVNVEFKDRSFTSLWKILLSKEPYNVKYMNILQLVKIMLVLPVSSAQCERTFSTMNRIKNDVRSSLNVQTVENLIRISASGPDVDDFNPEPAVSKWLSTERKIKLNYECWPDDDSL